MDALINRSRRTPNLKNRIDEATERTVIDYAIAFPAYGQHRISHELHKQGVFISGCSFCLVTAQPRELQKAP